VVWTISSLIAAAFCYGFMVFDLSSSPLHSGRLRRASLPPDQVQKQARQG
jgi:hypothetical protein